MERQNSKLISDILDDYIKESHLEAGLQCARVYDAWDVLMASMGAPQTVSKFYRDGTLTCRIPSSVVRTQLYFQSDLLVKKMNALLQSDCINKIVLL